MIFMLTTAALPAILSNVPVRGYSSAGRALDWQSRGQRFDPAYLHQKERQLTLSLFFNVGVLRNDRHGEAARGSLRSAGGAEHDQREYPAYPHQNAAANAAAFLFILRYSSAVIQRLLSIPPIPCFNSIPFFGHSPGKSTERDDLRAKLKIFVFSFNYIWINC